MSRESGRNAWKKLNVKHVILQIIRIFTMNEHDGLIVLILSMVPLALLVSLIILTLMNIYEQLWIILSSFKSSISSISSNNS